MCWWRRRSSRGLDIEGLPQVINFDMPHSPEDYNPPHRPHRPRRLTGEAISSGQPRISIDRRHRAADQEAHRAGAGSRFQPNAGTVAR